MNRGIFDKALRRAFAGAAAGSPAPVHFLPVPEATQAKIDEFRDTYQAFRQWFRRATGGNADVGAVLIKRMAIDPDGLESNIAFLLLEATGAPYYTLRHFRIAAEIALAGEP